MTRALRYAGYYTACTVLCGFFALSAFLVTAPFWRWLGPQAFDWIAILVA